MIKNILQGRFMRHPLHPVLVHLPIGFWIASLIFDIIYTATGNTALSTASQYAIGIGIVGALLAAPAGWAELVDIPKATVTRRIALTHATLNIFVIALYVLNFFMRGGFRGGPIFAVTGTEVILNAISVGNLMVSGYLGGTLVYQHGVGIRPEHVAGARPSGEEFREVA
jgi:uncharacterized membrane protein